MRIAVLALAVLLGLANAVYRFNGLGGPLGGFENDQFVHLSRSQQILLGEMPVRDFPEIGFVLTEYASAAAQWLAGPTLLSEAGLTIAALSITVALVVTLVWQLTGSMPAAAGAGVLEIAMAPRFYNYPKVFLYAVGIVLLWRYLARQTARRAIAAGVWVAVAFLFRHDHGVYLAVALAVTVAACRQRAIPLLARDLGIAAAAAFVCVLPYALFVMLHGGIASYVATTTQFASRDAGRTQFRMPWPTIDVREPLWRVEPPKPIPNPLVNVRWGAGVDEATRVAAERRLGLSPRLQVHADVWKYELADWSRQHLEKIVRDPLVADTHGIERRLFVIDDAAWPGNVRDRGGWSDWWSQLDLVPGVLRPENGVPAVYFTYVLIVIASALSMVTARRAGGGAAGPPPAAMMAPVLALALLMMFGFLRGSLASRLADASVPMLLLGALLAVRFVRRPDGTSALARLAAGVTVIGVVLVFAGGVQAIEDVRGQIVQAEIPNGATAVFARAAALRRNLSAIPAARAWTADNAPGSTRLALYIDACTAPGDRILVLAYLPELFYMSGRGFAAGQVSIMPGFFNSPAEQRQAIARIERYSTPVAIAESEALYEADYEPDFPLLVAYVAEKYREVGTEDRYRVFVRRDRVPTGAYGPLQLPCFR